MTSLKSESKGCLMYLQRCCYWHTCKFGMAAAKWNVPARLCRCCSMADRRAGTCIAFSTSPSTRSIPPSSTACPCSRVGDINPQQEVHGQGLSRFPRSLVKVARPCDIKVRSTAAWAQYIPASCCAVAPLCYAHVREAAGSCALSPGPPEG